MIKFKGQISERSKKFLHKRLLSSAIIASFIFAVAMCPFVFGLYGVLIGAVFDIKLWHIAIAAVLLLCFSVLMFIPLFTNQKIQKSMRVTLLKLGYESEYEDDFFYVNENGEKLYKQTTDVKKILDYGEVYIINFGYGEGYILCQKDLIAEGSIEEFEKLFEDLIIRKTG